MSRVLHFRNYTYFHVRVVSVSMLVSVLHSMVLLLHHELASTFAPPW